MSKIDPSLYLANNPAQTKQTGNSSLGKDEFLKILMAQLQNQDPLNPMEDKEFIAQMAQFTSLEQMVNMTSMIEKMVQSQTASQMINYQSFVGKDVTWHKMTDQTDENGQPIVETGNGTIASIKFAGESVQFTLTDGTVLEPANISELTGGTSSTGSTGSSSAVSSNPLVEASYLIGRTVTWGTEGDGQSAAVQSVSMKDGQIWLQLANGEKITASTLTKIE
ncbi:flagellar hook assembly protein FlgD [Domibacillus sp. DTU_2020_1001157_1_SI_ALB_TIR_016]|uniref:flagellar hook assembly protein FlgD n=1 Tax=Domibacillus sp. DTU_2020_1001157_1_SI_ALB_TIR_016 TaxID=3077789 RepID=UPI0028EF6B3E|nr:flagellar hook assembly protein FlgD [Domibacillus sp. DTU_2020_1001157_1_SI_ALB_TIR_016]WNS79724.1 flagellar hook assembly protein FlgD [Domibacillus sp. DTU_2020_1001157_1_SI_ALB_TIR_016]